MNLISSILALLDFDAETKSSHTDVGIESYHLLSGKVYSIKRSSKMHGQKLLICGFSRPSHFGFTGPTHVASNKSIMTHIGVLNKKKDLYIC